MFSADLSTRRFNGCTVVALRGELDLADAVAVTAALTAVAARDPVIIVDLAGLEFIDSSGVAALARGRTQARRAGGFSVYATVKQAGRFRERAAPVPRHPREARRPVPDQWPGTQALPARHSSGPPSGPDLATCRLALLPAAAGPEA